MTWMYQQSTGRLTDPNGVLVATGYSGGNCGKVPSGVNNPAMQSIKCCGPLPRGAYTLGTPVEGSSLGPLAIPLLPDPGNQMFGRGGFYMHGDTPEMNESASEGCIIMPHAIRTIVAASTDKRLEVVL